MPATVGSADNLGGASCQLVILIERLDKLSNEITSMETQPSTAPPKQRKQRNLKKKSKNTYCE